MTLKSIKQHNAERRRIHEDRHKPKPTGVKCPECDAELVHHPVSWLLAVRTREPREGAVY